MPGPEYHGWTHMPKSLGGTDPIPGQAEVPLLRVAKCTGSNFTATDGSYYGLAQLFGCDPSLYGCASTITIYNDPADGTGTWYVRTDGANDPGCLQMYNENFLMGYDIGVTFDGEFTGASAELWIGYGVGGGSYAYEFEYLTDPVTPGATNPTLRLTGQIPVDPSAWAGSASGNGQKIGGVLLCEGGDVAVLSTWCYLSVIADLESGTSTTYTAP